MDLSKMSYEEGVKELTKIIENLEQGDLTLSESFDNFKIGVEIYKHLNEVLNKVEGDIKIILKDEEKGAFEELFKLED
ncbi:exodeoxyribonuclease VII small subunit [Anaerosalibacter sp. Marseille-P3206]|uniref:exodeoxyribonuclease VII small subunit n=1 Tax=Anaerosalibacter sp. Marseille-P3206 TaxID=1871005 RepID=UPI000986DE77|nr:exodeoxyribonuclease VII small subunit [Anaerosalibacter sp. Marseille-P3206]